MSRTTTMTVRLSGALSDFVAANVGETGSYENVSEYIRDLIRRDKERVGAGSVRPAEGRACTMPSRRPESSYQPLTAADVIARNKDCRPAWPSVRIQEAASHRLDEIYRYTRDQWGVEQAERYITGLFEAFGKIETP